MNKNPLNINSNLLKWETPSIYSVKIDKILMQNSEISGEGSSTTNPGEDEGGDEFNFTPPLETYSNPFDYNSFDENPFAE